MLCDAHNHLQDDWLAPHLDAIAAEYTRLGIGAMVVNGTCEADWPRVAELAARFPFVRPSYGVHPWDVAQRSPRWRETLRARLVAEPHAAVGEVGIDRWVLEEFEKGHSLPGSASAGRAGPLGPPGAPATHAAASAPFPAPPPAPFEEQVEVFTAQLALAVELDRPATIHCLRAWGALDEILRRVPLPRRGFLLHAYGGPAELVAGFAEFGAYFSFNGSFLAERKTRQRAAFRVVPADRLLVETDAPAMPPSPPWLTHPLPDSPEGKTVNHPANLAATYDGLAQLRGVKRDELEAHVAENFARLFGPPPRA